jgi:hypothetical protein
MKTFFRLGAFATLVFVGAFLLYTASLSPLEKRTKVFSYDILGHQADLSIPDKEVISLFEKANERIQEKNRAAAKWEAIASVLAWLGFMFTSIVTLISASNGANSKSGNNSKPAAWLIPILAACSTVTIGASEKLNSTVDSLDKSARTLNQSVISAYKKLDDASSSESLIILQQMRNALEREN